MASLVPGAVSAGRPGSANPARVRLSLPPAAGASACRVDRFASPEIVVSPIGGSAGVVEEDLGQGSDANGVFDSIRGIDACADDGS